MAFSSEFKNQVISQILSNELTISAAHREYSIGKSTVHNWLKQVKAGVSNNTNLRAAIAAEGHCQILGFDSPETGLFCRSHPKVSGFAADNFRFLLRNLEKPLAFLLDWIYNIIYTNGAIIND